MKQRDYEVISEDYALLEKGQDYNRLIGHYETVNKNERFYRGDQWMGVNANGLPTPVFNIFKRIINHFIASLMSQKMSFSFNVEGVGYLYDPEERRMLDEACRLISGFLNYRLDRDRLEVLFSEGLLNAAISGDMAMYVYWDPDKRTSQGFRGDFSTALIDSTNIFFGDVNTTEVEDQPYILLYGREQVSRLKNEAAQNGATREELSKIIPDSDNRNQSGDLGSKELDGTKCSYVIKLYKKDGTVRYRKSTKSVLICPETDTGLRLYPIAFMNWDRVKNSYHGAAAATGLVDNQLYINKAFAMVMKHMLDVSFSKVVYNSNIIDEWTNAVGEAIAVAGPVENAAVNLNPGTMQNGFLDVISMTIGFTKELTGATDAALGNVRPDNTSAIIALQEASNLPLETQRRNLTAFASRLGMIWLDFILNYYDSSRMIFYRSEGEPIGGTLPLEILKDELFDCQVDVGASAYWSEIASVKTLDSLLGNNLITLEQYLDRIPDGYVPKKSELLEEVRDAARKAADEAKIQTNERT